MTLACGPFFSTEGLIASFVVLTVVKPLTYFAFIQAFRYRVCRPVPMSYRRAAGLAAVRALAGLGVIGASYLVLKWSDGEGFAIAWSCLVGERLALWFVLGKFGAALEGRRLVGWTISGTAIDLAYDFVIAVSLLHGAVVHLVATGVIAAFIFALHTVGRRDRLRARFGSALCKSCGYDLTGNLSGICPECGTRIALEPATDS